MKQIKYRRDSRTIFGSPFKCSMISWEFFQEKRPEISLMLCLLKNEMLEYNLYLRPHGL